MSSGGPAGPPVMTTLTWTSHQLAVPGATLHYEVAGSGPVLALVGHPMGAADFRALGEQFVGDHTVVLTDPRGFGASPLENEQDDADPERLADDLAAVLAAVSGEPADVFGSSGGAVTALAFAARHPHRGRTVVAHEPPLVGALPDAADLRAGIDGVVRTLHELGPGPAFDAFMALAGFEAPEPDPSADLPVHEPSEDDMRAGYRMLAHGLVPICTYRPDTAALRAATDAGLRLVVGAGQASGTQLARRCAEATAAELGTGTTYFPGDHAPWVVAMGDDPAPFAQRLREVLGEPATA